MKNQRHFLLYFLSIAAFTITLLTGLVSRAQDNRSVVTVGVPDFFLTQFKDSIVAGLEQMLPDVRIELRVISTSTRSPDAQGLEDYYKQIEANANAADVLLITPFDVTPESTRAGYFLDLKPLIDVDSAFDDSDFVPTVWNAYQWDGGTWALPSFFSPSFFVYDPAAFDQAGVTYPTTTWTMTELADAARKLTIKGTDGKGNVSGLFIDEISLIALFRALLNEPFYDNTVLPTVPRLANPDLAALMQLWVDLEAEGSATTQVDPAIFNQIPLRLGSVFDLEARGNVSGDDQRTLVGALLPNEVSPLHVIGFAVSKGTSQPEQSYQMVNALTMLPEIRTLFGGGIASRLSVQAVTVEGAYQANITPEEHAFVESTAQVGIAGADLLYGNYLSAALSRIRAGEDALTALQAAEVQANQSMHAAEEKSRSLIVAVATPVPNTVPDGKLTLTFGIFTGRTSLSNASDWQAAIDAFIANDPEVGNIKLEFVAPVTSDWGKKVEAFTESTDCFYPSYVGVDSFAGKLLNVDALMDVDPEFMRDDVLNGVLRDLERDQHIMGFPLSITPAMLRYDIPKFEAAGVPLPTAGWTIDEFASALSALKAQTPDQPAFFPNSDVGRYLFMLMAAYGALPIDPRTDPAMINYTSPEVVEGIRQVLDLAKSDTIRYSKTAAFIFRNNFTPAPLMVEGFSALSEMTKNVGLTTFPSGTEFTPVAYNLDAAYISANTAAPEACYRWLKALAHHPTLFAGIPTLQSVIDDPSTEALYGADTIATFRQFVETLSAPNTIILHDRLGGLGVAGLWLLRAFDNYVLNDADLEQGLADAERFTKEYLACVEAMGGSLDQGGIGGIWVEDKCVEKIDPTFMEIFAPPAN